MREQDRQRQILAAVGSLPGVLAWRNQSGALRNARGQLVRFGAPGSPDIVVIVSGRWRVVRSYVRRYPGVTARSKAGTVLVVRS